MKNHRSSIVIIFYLLLTMAGNSSSMAKDIQYTVGFKGFFNRSKIKIRSLQNQSGTQVDLNHVFNMGEYLSNLQ